MDTQDSALLSSAAPPIVLRVDTQRALDALVRKVKTGDLGEEKVDFAGIANQLMAKSLEISERDFIQLMNTLPREAIVDEEDLPSWLIETNQLDALESWFKILLSAKYDALQCTVKTGYSGSLWSFEGMWEVGKKLGRIYVDEAFNTNAATLEKAILLAVTEDNEAAFDRLIQLSNQYTDSEKLNPLKLLLQTYPLQPTYIRKLILMRNNRKYLEPVAIWLSNHPERIEAILQDHEISIHLFGRIVHWDSFTYQFSMQTVLSIFEFSEDLAQTIVERQFSDMQKMVFHLRSCDCIPKWLRDCFNHEILSQLRSVKASELIKQQPRASEQPVELPGETLRLRGPLGE